MNPPDLRIGEGWDCLLYTSDAADERSSVDLGGRRIIQKKKHSEISDDLLCVVHATCHVVS